MHTTSRHPRPARSVLIVVFLLATALPAADAKAQGGYSMSPLALVYDSEGDTSCFSDPIVPENTPVTSSGIICLATTVYGEFPFSEGGQAGSFTISTGSSTFVQWFGAPGFPDLSCDEGDPVVCEWSTVTSDDIGGGFPGYGTAIVLETPFVTEQTDITITATIEPLGGSPRGVQSDEITITVMPGEDLQTTMDAPAEVETGEEFDFDVTVRNNGASPSLPFELLAFVNVGWTPVSGSVDDCYLSNAFTLRCPLDAVAPGDESIVTFTARAPEDPVPDPGDVLTARWLNFDQEDDVFENDIAREQVVVVEGESGPDLVTTCQYPTAGKKATIQEIALGEETVVVCNTRNDGDEEASLIVVGSSFDGGPVRDAVMSSTSPDVTCFTTECEIELLGPGSAIAFESAFTPEQSGQLITTISASTDNETDPADNAVTFEWEVLPPDLVAAIEGPPAVPIKKSEDFIGIEDYPFTATITNVGVGTSTSSTTDISIPWFPDLFTGDAILAGVRDVPEACILIDDDPENAFLECENGLLRQGDMIQYGLVYERMAIPPFEDPDFGIFEDLYEIVADAIPVNPATDENPADNSVTRTFSAFFEVDFRVTREVETVPSGVTLLNGVEVVNNTDEPLDFETTYSAPDPNVRLDEVSTGSGVCGYDPDNGIYTCRHILDPDESDAIEMLIRTISPGEAEIVMTEDVGGTEFEQLITVTESQPLPDLTVDVTTVTGGDIENGDYVRPSEAYTVHVTATNIGDATSGGSTVELEWSHPDVEATPPIPENCSVFGGSHVGIDIVCETGMLEPGASAAYSFELEAPIDGVISHDADIIPQGLDEDYTNHFSTTSLLVAGDAIITEITPPEFAEPDVPEPLGIRLQNPSPETLNNVEVTVTADAVIETDSVPDLCDVDISETTLTASCPEFPADEDLYFPVALSFIDVGPQTVAVSVAVDSEGLYFEEVAVEVEDAPMCTLTKEILDDATPNVDTDFTYRISISSDEPIANVVLEDILPPGQFVSVSNVTQAPKAPAPPDCEYLGPDQRDGLRCEFPLPGGEVRTFKFIATDVDFGPTTNIARACGRTAKALIDAQDIRIAFLSDVFDSQVGEAFNIEADITNLGSEDAPGVIASINLGADVDDLFARFNSSLKCSFDGSSALCDLGTLPAGQTERVTVIARATGEGANLLSAAVSSTDGRSDEDVGAVDIVSQETRFAVANAAFGEGANQPGKGALHRLPAVDVYINDVRIADDLEPGTATDFVPLSIAGTEPLVEVVPADHVDNGNPMAVYSPDIFGEQDDGADFTGRTMLLLADDPSGQPALIVRSNALAESSSAVSAEIFLVHAASDAPTVNVRHVATGTILAEDLGFGVTSDYAVLEPEEHRIVIEDPETAEVLDGFRVDLSDRAGEAVAVILAGRIDDGSLGLLAFDSAGDAVGTQVQPSADTPDRFTLHGNYPNPFNPSTTLRFDLPARAKVSVDVFDALGRRVLTVPSRQLEAGTGRTFSIDASSLASGLYVYRIAAEGTTTSYRDVGRFVVLK